MLCPECKRRLSDLVDSCRCGWQRKSVAERSYVHCAHDTCPIGAMCRVKTATGWANLCETHYQQFFTDRANNFCASHGLDTHEKQMQFIKQKLATGRMFKAARMREPGDDDDIPVAA